MQYVVLIILLLCIFFFPMTELCTLLQTCIIRAIRRALCFCLLSVDDYANVKVLWFWILMARMTKLTVIFLRSKGKEH